MKYPEPLVFPSYFTNYFNLIKEESLMDAFLNRTESLLDFYQGIPADRWDKSYREGKWTITELVQHLLDSELVFLYRAMSMARGEKQPMIGFDENAYVKNTDRTNINREYILSLLHLLPKYSQLVFQSFSAQDLTKTGLCNNSEVSVAAIGYAIIGHDYHHRNKIVELYL
jgi:hypothetical protein